LGSILPFQALGVAHHEYQHHTPQVFFGRMPGFCKSGCEFCPFKIFIEKLPISIKERMKSLKDVN
jgi:hypothetical protein